MNKFTIFFNRTFFILIIFFCINSCSELFKETEAVIIDNQSTYTIDVFVDNEYNCTVAPIGTTQIGLYTNVTYTLLGTSGTYQWGPASIKLRKGKPYTWTINNPPEPTPIPTEIPTAEPTEVPTPTPTSVPTAEPTVTPIPTIVPGIYVATNPTHDEMFEALYPYFEMVSSRSVIGTLTSRILHTNNTSYYTSNHSIIRMEKKDENTIVVSSYDGGYEIHNNSSFPAPRNRNLERGEWIKWDLSF